jgi:hypothetical protein
MGQSFMRQDSSGDGEKEETTDYADHTDFFSLCPLWLNYFHRRHKLSGD